MLCDGFATGVFLLVVGDMSSNLCPHCGEPVQKDAYLCPNCSQLVDPDSLWSFCEQGARTCRIVVLFVIFFLIVVCALIFI